MVVHNNLCLYVQSKNVSLTLLLIKYIVLGGFSCSAFLTGIERTLSVAPAVRMSAITMLMGRKNVILADNDSECSHRSVAFPGFRYRWKHSWTN